MKVKLEKINVEVITQKKAVHSQWSSMDKMIGQKVIIIPPEEKNMNDEVKQILFGSLLGDGCLPKDNVITSARFSERHCLKQKEYLLWKKNLLKKELVFENIYYDKNKKIIGIRSRFSKELMIIRTIFYPNGKKVVSWDILNQLTPLGFAVWYCDDGTYGYQSRFCRIFTYSFNHKEHILIQKCFKEKWNINCQVCIDSRKQYYIHLDSINAKRFLKLIKPSFERYNIPKCMWYKLGHFWTGNKERIELAKKKHRKSHNLWYQQPEVREKKRLYYQRNLDKILKQRKKYCQKPEVRERRRKYMREYSKDYQRKNRDKINKYKREWRKRRKTILRTK